jgi:hypothetical protein
MMWVDGRGGNIFLGGVTEVKEVLLLEACGLVRQAAFWTIRAFLVQSCVLKKDGDGEVSRVLHPHAVAALGLLRKRMSPPRHHLQLELRRSRHISLHTADSTGRIFEGRLNRAHWYLHIRVIMLESPNHAVAFG